MEIEHQEFGSVRKQEDCTFVQRWGQTETIATTTVHYQTDLQMFKSDKHGALRKMFTNTSSQSMEKLCEE